MHPWGGVAGGGMKKTGTYHRERIREFVRLIALRTSTENLIRFVAEEDGMLASCRYFAGVGGNQDAAWLEQECRRKGLDPSILHLELRRVLTIFDPGVSAPEPFKMLDLDPGAELEEIRKAYRRLCMQYHPDTSSDGGDTGRFMQINAAYRRLMETRQTDADESPWLYRESGESSAPERFGDNKRHIATIVTVVSALAAMAIAASFFYDRKVLFDQYGGEIPTQRAAAPIQPLKTLKAAKNVSNKKMDKTPPKQQPAHDLRPVRVVMHRHALQLAAQKPAAAPPRLAARAAGEKLDKAAAPLATADENAKPKGNPPLKKMPPPQVPQRTTAGIPHEHKPLVMLKSHHGQAKTYASAAQKTQNKIVMGFHAAVVQKDGTGGGALLSRPVPDALSPDPSIMDQRIRQFLSAYTSSYERKDMNGFAGFFEKDATENGKAFIQLGERYREIFAKAESIEYEINDYKWTVNDSGILVNGRFRASFRYPGDEKVAVKGNISLLLTDAANKTLKVKTLRYQFN